MASATTPLHDRQDHMPLRVMALERDLAAQIAFCRDCRRDREKWSNAMAKEFSEFRAQISEDLVGISKQLMAGMTRLDKRLDSMSRQRKPRRT